MTEEEERLARIEAQTIARSEEKSLGHRIIFGKDGWSRNIFGCYCDPSKLDEEGYQVRL